MDLKNNSQVLVIISCKRQKTMKKYTLGQSRENLLEMIPEGRIKKMKIGSKLLGLVRRGSDFYAFDAFCPHRGALLTEGHINPQNEISCPLHQYRFELKTGKVVSGYCPELTTYPCVVSETGLEITLP